MTSLFPTLGVRGEPREQRALMAGSPHEIKMTNEGKTNERRKGRMDDDEAEKRELGLGLKESEN